VQAGCCSAGSRTASGLRECFDSEPDSEPDTEESGDWLGRCLLVALSESMLCLVVPSNMPIHSPPHTKNTERSDDADPDEDDYLERMARLRGELTGM
jgi:hypothetical protein